MAAPARVVVLSPAQAAELVALRDRYPKAYVREKAAAILKVAAGAAVRRVARDGLLRRHRPETVGGWIDRYLGRGPDGLLVAAGRGRKPAFSPDAPLGPGRRR